MDLSACCKSLFAATATAFAFLSGTSINSANADQASIDQWIQSETPIATQLMLANVSRAGTTSGSVVAAPTYTPDYYFNWIRDSAITMDSIVALYQATQSQDQAPYLQMLSDYVGFSRQLQLTPNMSGAADGLGLGEPKFNMDGSAFNEPWGRPQNDGPALRTSTLVHLANLLLATSDSQNTNFVTQYLYDGKLPSNSVIKNDLEYLANHWQDASYDLWEEVKGTHFFTQMVQRRALIEGAQLATTLGDSQAASFYQAQATAMEQSIQSHWDSTNGVLDETINYVSGVTKPSGLDVAVVLGALRGATDDGFMSVTNDEVFATAEKLRQSFASLYPINQVTVNTTSNQPMGTAIGRYPEDTFNGSATRSGGNPWFLATSAFAEFYHQCANTWQKSQQIIITDANASILQGLRTYSEGALNPGETLTPSDERFSAVIQALRDAGDAELQRVYYHAGTDGSMSEEFDRNTGFMTSAANLTWSYAALLTAVDARQ